MDVEIDRGVTHQIRVHLQTHGLPIVGDPLYGGDRPDRFGLRRQFLHAWRLAFRHPETGRTVAVESPLPDDLKWILIELGMAL